MTSFAVFTPGLAAGAAAAAVGVPLLIHLLFRKRYQIVPWAAIRFLMVAERRHRRRIDQWLLLALRVLAILLPLLAMVAATSWAEPLWQAIRPGATETTTNVPRTHHVIILDASLSMNTRGDEGRTRFDNALVVAEDLVRSSGAGDGFTVLVLNGGIETLVPGPANDPDKVIAELKKIKPTHTATNVASVLGTVAEILARSPRAYPRRQVTFLTDLQRSAWANALPHTDAPQPETWQRIFARSEVVVVDLARTDTENLAIAAVELQDPLPFVDSPGILTAVVANFSRTDRQDVVVQLLVGRPAAPDALVPIEQQKLKVVPAGGRATITFGLDGKVRFLEKGNHVLQVKLLEPDDLPADDARSLSITVRDGLRAILVDGKADPTPLRRGAGYLQRALYPPDARPADTPARPRSMTPAEFLDPSAGDLSGVNVVYLCDIPTPTPELVTKLDALLKRGGGVVIGLGPNAAANREAYNRILYDDGKGILPAPLGNVITATGPDDLGFRLAADEEDYRKPPLLFFLNEKIRGGLIMAPFRTYMGLETSLEGRARRILSFVPAGAPPVAVGSAGSKQPDAALVETLRHRGRVLLFTSSFNEDWNDWPPLPSYLMFQQEFIRFAATSPGRHTIQVGDAIEEFYPPATAGQTATLNGPEGISASLPLILRDEAGLARFSDTRLSGLYRLRLSEHPDQVFAVNPVEAAPGAGYESDLRRTDGSEIRSVGAVQVVSEIGDVQPSAESGAVLVSGPKPHGPTIARVAVLVALAVLVVELLLAWRWGPSRAAGAGTATGSIRPVERRFSVRLLSTTAAMVPLLLAGCAFFTLAHYEKTGNLLGFLPDQTQQQIESSAGVPAAQPGEGTRWRLEGFTAFVANALLDRRIVIALAIAALILVVVVYRSERRAVAGFHRLITPGLLRASIFLLALFVLLPQLRLAFDREGWPDIVILIDTSASMSHSDDFKDAAVKAKAEELVGVAGISQTQRLQLARMLLTRNDSAWLEQLLTQKQVKVHIYATDETTRPIADIEQVSDIADGQAAINRLKANGESSRLGEGVEAVLRSFRGGSLAALIMFTDGNTTAGDDLPKAAREASRAGVPLFLVGVGDVWEVPDVELTDLQAEDTITVGDRIVFDARLVARGQVPSEPISVVLFEKVNGQLVERGRQTITPDVARGRVPVTVAHTPYEAGEKTFVLVAPTVAGETDTSNNRLERTVMVTDSRRLRVLYVEGYPRYDFRFVKVLMERESERSLGGKGIAIDVLLLSASKEWTTTDRSAEPLRGAFPTRSQLFGYDVVILGDVDPKQIPRSHSALQDLSDFVRVKGGGLLFLSGEHGTPAAYADTPLAEVLPVTPDPMMTRPTEWNDTATMGFRPQLTPAGRQHPLFRFSPDDVEASSIWNRLQPLFWFAKGYRKKPNTVVLATHPNRPAEGGAAGENHPLVIQSFAGLGPVLFLGFDDTWRWRFRNDEEHFDRFWVQTVRVLSRSQTRRVELKVLPKTEYRRDEKMTVVVRFPVEAPSPPPGKPVRVVLTRSPLQNADGKPGIGTSETTTLTLARVPGPGVQYETVLARTPEGEYRFTLADPEPEPGQSPATAVARVLPPLNEMDRLQLNAQDLESAAAISGGKYYNLANAEQVFNDLPNLERVPLNQPCPPVQLWNSPVMFVLLVLLLSAEWLLRKRERLL